MSAGFSLDDLWSKSEKLTLECISTLMYLSYCGNREKYMEFVERNLKSILTYLKQRTRSHRVFIDSEKNAIHVEYILRLRNIKTGNEQSVSRLKFLCKTLPIFRFVLCGCTQADGSICSRLILFPTMHTK